VLSAKRPEKKSETLEVRIGWSDKQAFMARCRKDGVAASERLRTLIRQHLDAPAVRSMPTRRRIATMKRFLTRKPRTITGTVLTAAGAGVLALATPSLASVDTRAAFSILDKDGSGGVSFAEFLEHAVQEGLFLAPGADPGAPERLAGEDEVLGTLRSEFARYDRNRDGELVHDEFSSRYVWRLETSFRAIDRDRDGAIEQAELARVLGARGLDAANLHRTRQARAEAVMEALDSNGDGRLDFSEYSAS